MNEVRFTLGEFQGPLDLLLHLIARHQLDIYDIPIVELLEQYLRYLDTAGEQDLDELSSFLTMAARLVHIKTVMLLPKQEEAEELKQELTGELLEYKLCREIAQSLGQRSRFEETFAHPCVKQKDDGPYRTPHSLASLTAAYLAMLGKGTKKLPPPIASFSGIVHRRFVPVSSKIVYILGLLYQQERLPYPALFAASRDKSELVATFLAVLELVKSRRVWIEGENEEELTVCFNHAYTQERSPDPDDN